MEQGLERLVVSIVLMGVFIAAGKKWGAIARRALGNRSHAGAMGNPGSPTLLYFWSRDCASCAVQERHIEEAQHALEKEGRRLDVRKVNAIEETALARSMKVVNSVMRCPTPMARHSTIRISSLPAPWVTARRKPVRWPPAGTPTSFSIPCTMAPYCRSCT